MWLALFWLACKGPGSDTDTGGPAPTCGPDAIVVDAGFDTRSVEFTYAWDSDALLALGPVFEFEVPADVVSFSATVDSPGSDVGFGLVSFDERVWVDGSLFDGEGAWDTEPYFHWGVSGGTVVAPIVPGNEPLGGCLRLQPASIDDLSGETGRMWVVTRSGEVGSPVVDLNIGIVGNTDIDAGALAASIDIASGLWTAGGGPEIGDVQQFSVPGGTFLDYADSTALRSTVLDANRSQALNVFLVQDYLQADGTLGEAGGIPGPLGLQGVDEAGVILAVDSMLRGNGSLDTQLFGETLAHEVGHQMGLFHTTESDGTRLEGLEDTPACPPSADANGDDFFSASECRDHDGENFMFWSAGNFDQDRVSADQAFVLSHSPVVY